MSTPVTIPTDKLDNPAARWKSIALVFCCTILGAAAQILMKTGANHLKPGLMGVITNLPLFCGYALYGMSTVLLVLALKDGELSLLYPVIALTYVWVTGLSFLIFHDTVNPIKLVGIVTIVIGVAVLGTGGKS
ncbi:MAG: hypothetical protein P4L56_17065 [Candidatus Sulfopaludibacter sp.]|nr:hypothetical protein [Candidatus Sulfopaludibacter sp.]